MPMCYQKWPFVVWDGTNLAELETFLSEYLYEGSVFALEVDGDQLHFTDSMGTSQVLPPGTVFGGVAKDRPLSSEAFSALYNVISS